MPFLLARIAEDHAAIDDVVTFLLSLPPMGPLDPTDAGMEYLSHPSPGHTPVARWVPMVHPQTEDFTSRHDPDRARWDATAREQIAAIHRETEGRVCGTCIEVVNQQLRATPYPCPTLLALTWPYSDHDDYDTLWDTGGLPDHD